MRICEGGRWRGCKGGGCDDSTSIAITTVTTNNNINNFTSTDITTPTPPFTQNHGGSDFDLHLPQHERPHSPSSSCLYTRTQQPQHRGRLDVSDETKDHNHCRPHEKTTSHACNKENTNATTSTLKIGNFIFKNINSKDVPSSKDAGNHVDTTSNKRRPLRCPNLPRASAPHWPSSRLSQPRHTNLLTLLLALLVLFASLSDACAPRGGSGTRRHRRKLTPLVFKQHVPNVSENTLGASGLTDGPIKRKDPRFKDLVRNNNPDIWFRDEEGTGDDRIMSQRCKDKLNILAISVLNQWPGVKLRVTEAWDEDNLHAENSLHYEGRAVDITTSDMDRTKYGMLARLAVEAGFDWVYYESRSHVHCSVKSDSSVAINFGGCYSADSLLSLPGGGTKSMSEVKVGDSVLTTDTQDGSLVFSEVVAFLDRNPDRTANFYTVRTASGRAVTLTGKHLLYYLTQDDVGGPRTDIAARENKADAITDSYTVMNASISGALEEAKHLEEADRSLKFRGFDERVSQGVSQDYRKEFPHGRLAYAEELRVGQYLLQVPATPTFTSTFSLFESSEHEDLRKTSDTAVPSQSSLTPDRIVSIETNKRKGVYGPLTAQGTVVVDGYVTSCYAFLKDVNLAHTVMAPVRAYHVMKKSVNDWLNNVIKPAFDWLTCWPYAGISVPVSVLQTSHNASLPSEDYSSEQDGAHWYARLLYSIAVNVLGMEIFISI